MGLLIKKNICLMGLLTKNKNMPYGPTHKENALCLMGLFNKNMPYGPTHKENYMPYGPTHKQ